MSALKDKERFYLIVKVFLDLHGPATSKEISEYIKKCPIRLQKEFTPVKIGVLLRGQRWAKRERAGEGRPWKYWVET